MASKAIFEEWVVEALTHHNRKATILQVSKFIWSNYEKELREEDEIFYKWQYIFRWAAKTLRDKGIMKPVKDSPYGIWELK